VLAVSCSKQPRAVLCSVDGELDAFCIRAFREATSPLGSLAGPVVVDLSGVTFVDGSGLAALIGLTRRCHERSVDVVFCAKAAIARALRGAGFDRIAPMAAGVDEAIRLVAGSPESAVSA